MYSVYLSIQMQYYSGDSRNVRFLPLGLGYASRQRQGLPPPPGPTHAANSFQLEDRNRGTLKLDNHHSGRRGGWVLGRINPAMQIIARYFDRCQFICNPEKSLRCNEETRFYQVIQNSVW
jgi:hypothetical protein